MSTTAGPRPAIPPRPSRSQEKVPAAAPMVPPRPTHPRIQRSISPNPDRFAQSPLNESLFTKSDQSLQPASRNGHSGDPIARSTSVELPSLGEEGKEYAGLSEELSAANEGNAGPAHTSTVAQDLKLHAPKPSLPASSAKQRVMAVTRTDSERAASFGIGRASSIEDSTPPLPSNRSLKKKASTTSQLSAGESHVDDEHGIPEIGQQVPMYPNAGDVQAPSPAPAAAEGLKPKHHTRRTSGRGNLPPGSYGLHGHGVLPQDKLEKAYYDKHPEKLKKERVPHHYDRPNDFSMSSDDLNKIVRDTANRGSGVGAKDYTGTPSDQIGWQALEESTSRVASPGLSPAETRPDSAMSDSDKGSRRISTIGEVIHVDEPNRRRSVMFSDTESVNAEEEVERPYTAPILAEDEVAKDPSAHIHQPAVEPPAFEIEEPTSRPSSRPASLYKETSFELRSTPLEDVEEYEPLFNDDEKAEAKKPAVEEEKPKKNHKQRFPSADIWEDAPSSVFYTTEVSTPELFDEQEKPSPAVAPPPREGETPAQVFARHQEELAEKETREHGPEGFIPARNTQKPLWAQHQKHLASETAASRPALQQRFPSRDVWEDAPDSLKLETTVSTPQQAEEAPASPADILKPEIPERPRTKSPAEKPAIPQRPKPRQASGDDKPAVPGRPKPQIPARPVKTSPAPPTVEPTDATATPPLPRPKPAIPARPMGSKIAALQAGFMNDLNRRLQLGPQAPPTKKEEEPTEEAAVEEKKEKVPLSDVRKGRARGPQRRAPARVAAPAPVAEVKEAEAEAENKVVFGFSTAMRVFEIDPFEGRLSAGGIDEGAAFEAKVESVEEKEKVNEISEEQEKEKESSAEKEKEKESASVEVPTASSSLVDAGEKSEEAEEKGKSVVASEQETEAKVEEETKVEPKVEPKAEPETKTEAEVDAEAKPEPESAPEKEEPETKTLATNLAGVTLLEEQVKKDEEHDTVEPVKVLEN